MALFINVLFFEVGGIGRCCGFFLVQRLDYCLSRGDKTGQNDVTGVDKRSSRAGTGVLPKSSSTAESPGGMRPEISRERPAVLVDVTLCILCIPVQIGAGGLAVPVHDQA